MPTILTMVCEECGKEFERQLKSVNYAKARGCRCVCSKECAWPKKGSPSRIPIDKRVGNGGSTKGKIYGDEYSPYKCYLRGARSRCNSPRNSKRPLECTITLEDLKNQWEKQQGICVYTKMLMLLYPTTTQAALYKHDKSPWLASLDRIDSSKGYTKDNIQFVTMFANYAKNSFTHDEMIQCCVQIAKAWS